MNVMGVVFAVALCGVISLAGIIFYLLKVISDLEKENASLQPPFQASWGGTVRSTFSIKFKINVLRPLYNGVMRKKMKPLGKRNQARAKAESKALFQAMLRVGKHTIATPENRKGTRASNKAKAIKESM